MSVPAALSVRHYTISSRPVSTKNSRALGSGKSFLNARARVALSAARVELKKQHRGKPLSTPHAVSIRIYYANLKSHLDLDNGSAFVLDSLKGIILEDDSPRFVARLEVESSLSRRREDHIEIELRPYP